MSSSTESPTIAASGGVTSSRSRTTERSLVGLHPAVGPGGDRTIDVELVVGDEVGDLPAAVRTRPSFSPSRAQPGEHGQDVSYRSKFSDRSQAGHLDREIARGVRVAAHPANDPLGEREPELLVVTQLRVALQRHERRSPGLGVAGRVELEPVLAGPGAGIPRPGSGPGFASVKSTSKRTAFRVTPLSLRSDRDGRRVRRRARALDALRHRDFRLLFTGQTGLADRRRRLRHRPRLEDVHARRHDEAGLRPRLHKRSPC